MPVEKIGICTRCGKITDGGNLCESCKNDLKMVKTTDRDHYRTGNTTSEIDHRYPTFRP